MAKNLLVSDHNDSSRDAKIVQPAGVLLNNINNFAFDIEAQLWLAYILRLTGGWLGGLLTKAKTKLNSSCNEVGIGAELGNLSF